MKKFASSALARGLMWQAIGWLAGALFVTGIRALMGLTTFDLTKFFFTEPAWVFGGLVGGLFFLAWSGVVSDWFKWAKGESTPEHREDPEGWEKYINVSSITRSSASNIRSRPCSFSWSVGPSRLSSGRSWLTPDCSS